MFVASSHLFVFVVFDRVSNNTTFISEHYLVPNLRLLLAFFLSIWGLSVGKVTFFLVS